MTAFFDFVNQFISKIQDTIGQILSFIGGFTHPINTFYNNYQFTFTPLDECLNQGQILQGTDVLVCQCYAAPSLLE